MFMERAAHIKDPEQQQVYFREMLKTLTNLSYVLILLMVIYVFLLWSFHFKVLYMKRGA